jgi:AcrR family transcriptional regulator
MVESDAQRSRQPRAERTRQRILEIGAELISHDGYHATSSKKIAAAAGISVGSFYNHFHDKKDLLLTIYLQHCRLVHEMIGAALDEGGFARGGRGGRAMVQAIITQALALHTLSPEFHRQMVALRYTDPEVARVVEREDRHVVQMLIGMLSTSGRALRVKDLEAAAWVVIASVEEIVHAIKMSSPPVAEERLIAVLSDMIHRFLFR